MNQQTYNFFVSKNWISNDLVVESVDALLLDFTPFNDNGVDNRFELTTEWSVSNFIFIKFVVGSKNKPVHSALITIVNYN